MPATLEARSYERKKQRAAQRERDISASARELAPLPAIKDPERRKRCLADPIRFCLEYFPEVFFLRFSDDHLYVIDQLKNAIVFGLQVALAMPRSSGKTSIVVVLAIWAILSGHRRYVMIVAAADPKAERILESIRIHLTTRQGLIDDFPEVCVPMKRIGRNNQRRLLWYGRELSFGCTKTQIQLPNVPGSKSYGAIIETAGITGTGVRGPQITLDTGEVIRPDLALVDDPQTDDSAKSETQCEDRLRTVNGAVLGMSGPVGRIASVACVTVIRKGDMADQLLDRKTNAAWRGIRFKLMDQLPSSELWQEYFRIRQLDQQNDGDESVATEFYAENQEEMDADAVPRWPDRFDPDREISATQHAMNLLQDRGEEVFHAEYQNDPLEEDTASVQLRKDDIKQRLSRIKRGRLPLSTHKTVAFVDVHEKLLYWMVVAASSDCTPYIVDCGTYPKQRISVFQMRNCKTTIQTRHRAIPTKEGRIYAALHELYDQILGKSWIREDKTELPIDLLMTDAQWGEMQPTVYKAIREHANRSRILPSHGKFIGASSEPISRWKKRPGDRIGEEWRIAPKNGQMSVTIDTNYWKTFAANRLLTDPGSPGATLLFGEDREAHELTAQHFVAEYPTEVESKIRRINEWKLKSSKPDNHLWDCYVNCLVALSILGVKLLPDKPLKPATRQPRESESLF